MMSSAIKTLCTALIGIAIGGLSATLFMEVQPLSDKEATPEGEKKPLYWVAPMDANYRRDQPGKSPMGMDLVPVYDEPQGQDEFGPGVVKIASHVVNNLGVRTATVKRSSLQASVSTVGYVQYDEHELVHIHPRVDGWVDNLYVKAIGDEVEQGQALYDLYSPELVNAQKEMLVALKQSDQQLIDAARKRLRALKMSVDFIEKLIKTKQVRQTVTFYTPQSGVVENLKIREGYYVQPGTTMMSIGKLDQVWVEAEVFERQAAVIKPGLPVTMELDYLPGKSWLGEVDYVYPSLDAQNRTLRVRLKFDNPGLILKPNMFARVDIEADPTHGVLTVPASAVIRTGAQNRVVLALGDGQFKSIEIEIGRINDTAIEVVSGLAEGEEVVTSAQFLIDSESSKTSDFKRMQFEERPKSVWMQGEVNSVMVSHRKVNITHEPVEVWDWPTMTMNFNVAKAVEIETLQSGQLLHFEVTEQDNGGYELTGIHIMAQAKTPTATVKGVINHVDQKGRILNISREAIDKWNRPAATMDFVVADTLEFKEFNVGDEILFTFEVKDDLVIVAIQVADDEQVHDSHAHH
ncbi:efflux RND transporter periplasmic adaptor subunit [Pseudoalteromonas sp. Of7M-16]|uniref:efflux RND transporter periplasmic adaptor subunit n=1 Tax=Pseudoalteromonas sp. Of7M-16 TaxID=2917756 RepID=UPI001EF4D7AB|nr:efflux RND transporter periplasmic adaptor subunit [Pseudoalteromonas sp. Of7M-16]MCG7548493.1 efflux RND transporter periplasmic adaptor subunit [Pseudoalteromonas sp. Of7M-16]